ncbi:hypothetical protein [Acidithiobacillus marinus]|nr:hypothetical protein [Acidithiobacillus marinus]
MSKPQQMPGTTPIPPDPPKNTLGLRFTAEHFPASASFAIFMETAVFGSSSIKDNPDWGDQITEKLSKNQLTIDDFANKVRDAANRAFNTPLGRALGLRAYNLFGDLLTGNAKTLGAMHLDRRFIMIVSAPRHGGSYLTKEMYRAVGVDAKAVPNYLAHDGYPDASSFWYKNSGGHPVPATRTTIQQTAEWLIMSDWYFRNLQPADGLKNIVKKGTKMVYMPDFFRETFGPKTEWIIAVRHPAAACVSTYEKSGGLPDNECFPEKPRSVIERWVMDSWVRDGFLPSQVGKMPYFTAYLHYWVRYHQILMVGGMLRGNPRHVLIGYHPDVMEGFILTQINRYKVAENHMPERFYVSQKAIERHPDWVQEARSAIENMETLWQSFGHNLPEEIHEVF